MNPPCDLPQDQKHQRLLNAAGRHRHKNRSLIHLIPRIGTTTCPVSDNLASFVTVLHLSRGSLPHGRGVPAIINEQGQGVFRQLPVGMGETDLMAEPYSDPITPDTEE